MIRRLALALCASLLALCLAACLASYTTWGQTSLRPQQIVSFRYAGRDYHLWVGLVDGQIEISFSITSPTGEFVGRELHQIHWQKSARIPLWLVCILLAAVCLGLVYIGRRSKRLQRLRNACCIKCGYNLTGNISGTCSECGTAVPEQGKP